MINNYVITYIIICLNFSYHPPFQCLSMLLKRVPKGEADEPDNDEMTSLHWSVSYGSAEHVKLLLKAGCTVTLTDLESMLIPLVII